MTLVRWTPRTPARMVPNRDVSPWTNTYDNWFDEFFGLSPATKCDWMPALDVREEDNRYLVTVDLPGLSKQEVELTYENDVLTISGERKTQSEKQDGRTHRIERFEGKFTRSLRFPGDVDGEKVDAAFKDGVLEVVLPKSEGARARKIEVK